MKLSLHHYSRVAFVRALAQKLKAATDARVLMVLSAGVHSAYTNWKQDPSVKDSYSLRNAADAAGFVCFYALHFFSMLKIGFILILQQRKWQRNMASQSLMQRQVSLRLHGALICRE